MSVSSPNKPVASPAPASTEPRSKAMAYIALTKPRIIELLLVTTVPMLILAERGLPHWSIILNTLVGGTLGAGSANTLNCVIDRDIDEVMNRTKRRPLVTGEVTARQATVFGIGLGVAAFVWLWFLVNPLSAWLVLVAEVIYVVGYTMILKRRTPQNIVWGGLAGCMPVLVGWTAVTNSLDWAPVTIFGVIFFWTPPHYWPLSMRFRGDYARAGVPMLPVVANDRRVAIEMIIYTVAMVACSLALVPLADMGWFYTIAAAVLGGWFLWLCVRLYLRSQNPKIKKLGEMKVFHHSITYLTLLSLAIIADVFLPW